MVFNLLNASFIANAAISIAPIIKKVIVMSTIQSNSPEIERAATQQTYLFVGYVILLLLTLIGTVLLYRAGNKYQATVKADADARILEAKAEAAKANEEIARLQKDIAEARRRQAEAERALLELQERLRPRKLSAAQRRKLTAALDKAPTGAIEIECVHTPDNEPLTFANELAGELIASGWTVLNITSSI
jgi:hypothetical protein